MAGAGRERLRDTVAGLSAPGQLLAESRRPGLCQRHDEGELGQFEFGRAPCRERVYLSVCAVPFHKQTLKTCLPLSLLH